MDNHATTPCDPAVLEAMLPYFSTNYGNASSGHLFGQAASNAINRAQSQVSNLLGSLNEEIIFTSGATESNNLALLGTARAYCQSGGKRRRLVTTQIEHKAILAPMEQLRREGWTIEFLPIDCYGQVDLKKSEEIINEDTFLVSMQLANSEIGTIQPLASVVELAHNKGSLVHSDACQALGKIQVDTSDLGLDLLSLSGHKIYGPKGIGVLWVKSTYKFDLLPIMFGGGQGKNLRPGTLPVPLIIGMGKACELLNDNFVNENERIARLRNTFEDILLHRIPKLVVNGSKHNRLPNNSNLTFPNLDAEAILANMPDIIASTGSACESGSIEPSRTLLAIGISTDNAYSTIRFGFGRFNTEGEVIYATNLIVEVCENLRTMSN